MSTCPKQNSYFSSAPPPPPLKPAHLSSFVCFFWPHRNACGDLSSPDLGWQPHSWFEVWHFNRWTTRDVPSLCHLGHLPSILGESTSEIFQICTLFSNFAGTSCLTSYLICLSPSSRLHNPSWYRDLCLHSNFSEDKSVPFDNLFKFYSHFKLQINQYFL